MSASRKIFVRGFEIWFQVGVYPYEQEGPQRILIDVEITLNDPPGGLSDELSQTFDYDWIGLKLREIADGEPCKLLETIAERFIVDALKQPIVASVKIALEKPSVSETGEHRGVEVYRSK